ncbi:MAG TPA: GTPase HflX [Spirochaetota bacterium]|nr:GTPase HflX [Spirochaetota bacterium]
MITISQGLPAESEEIHLLAESCGYQVLADLSLSTRSRPGHGLPGSGKLAELEEIRNTSGCDFFILSYDLAPSRKRSFENAVGCPVMTRTELILEIFARRARTAIARQQVELARLEYLLPRLEGGYAHLAASQGGSGFRGPGETQIELDRRRIKNRISLLRRRLAAVKTSRREQRKKREKNIPLVALCGYTNAGKTTLMNRLAKTNLQTEDRLFATLDPTVRQLHNPNGSPMLLVDTVGFIRDIPHTLVEAFASTLEEITRADLVLVVFDASDHAADQEIPVVESVLAEIDADRIPRLYCANKIDMETGLPSRELAGKPLVRVSAKTGEGIDNLLRMLHTTLFKS